MKKSKTCYTTSASGAQIANDVTGNGPPLMLLHGAGKTRKEWHTYGYVERLQTEFTVITVDIRGSGDSQHFLEIDDYAVEKICADLLAVADACAVERFGIWGFSFGGNIARYLGAWSERVSALALIGVPFGPAVDADFDRYIDKFVKQYSPVAEAARFGRLPEKEHKSAIKGQIPQWVACFQAMRGWPAIQPADLRCPSLLLYGTRDDSAANWVAANRSALEQAGTQLVVLDGLTHWEEFTQVEQTLPVVSSFFTLYHQQRARTVAGGLGQPAS